MVYPFLKKGNKKLKEYLLKDKIYFATYWENVDKWIKDKQIFEIHLYENLIPLPIDQRYNIDDMQFVIEKICEYL